MSKVQATELRPGTVIQRSNALWRVVKCEHVHVGGRGGAYMQVELKGVRDGTKVNERIRTEEKVERPFIESRKMQFLYRDGDSFVCMDVETYEQTQIDAGLLEDAASFMMPETEVSVQMLDGTPIGIDLPASVVMEIAQTEPRIKGATATASYKPATTASGFSLMVPPFVEAGESVRVSTATGEYLERTSG